MAYATSESAAYQTTNDSSPALGRFDTRKKETTVAPVHSVSTAPQKASRKRRLLTPLRMFVLLVFASLFAATIYSHMELTKLTKEIGEREAKLEELQSTHVSLLTKREEIYNTDYIEEYAQNQLGMVKLDASQMEYIELSNPEKIEVTGVGASVSGTVGTLVRGFTAILEYLQ